MIMIGFGCAALTRHAAGQDTVQSPEGIHAVRAVSKAPVLGEVYGHLTKADTSAEILKVQYLGCSNRHDKLAFCVSLLDSKSLRVGTRMSTIKTIFGPDADDYGLEKGIGKACVSFADVVQNRHPEGGASALEGWYLAVYYTQRGIVSDYFLSNLWLRSW